MFFQHLQRQLQLHLQEPVEMQSYSQVPAIDQGLANTRRELYVFSTGSQFGNAQTNNRHMAQLEPLMVFSEVPWCLFAQRSTWQQATDLHDWLAHQKQPVKIAINAIVGPAVLWAQLLSRSQTADPNAPSSLQIATYPIAYQPRDMFDQGAALVLSYCWRAVDLSPDLQVIAQSSPRSAAYLRNVPSFAMLKLPPLQAAWVTLFSEKNLSAPSRQRLIAALEHIAAQPETAFILENHVGLKALRFNHAQSQQYMQDYLRTWQSVTDLLQWKDIADTELPAAAP